METTTVLVVDHDPVTRELVGAWLEEAGYDVLGCPGPDQAYHCVGVRRGRCALAHGARVAVLDLPSTADATAALCAFYATTGTTVVGTGARPDRESVLAAVCRALAEPAGR